ncbi:MAG: hypothetical protein SFV15_14755 [Polyangiaceae bacterium]|nr:hypothetical protein [Polyangiaceae bacterium]
MANHQNDTLIDDAPGNQLLELQRIDEGALSTVVPLTHALVAG